MAQRAFDEVGQASAETRSKRPVDLVHLAKQCLGDEKLEQEILHLFGATLSTSYGRLKLAVGFDDLAINLHSIKGAASGVGAWGVAELAKDMESELRAARPLTSERIEDLGVAVEEVRDFIARLLPDETA